MVSFQSRTAEEARPPHLSCTLQHLENQDVKRQQRWANFNPNEGNNPNPINRNPDYGIMTILSISKKCDNRINIISMLGTKYDYRIKINIKRN